MKNATINIDGFRFIDNLHTTARQLPVFTSMIRALGTRELSKSVIEKLLIEWSTNEEENNSTYKKSKGKVTNNGVKTGALRYHIEMSNSLGLTNRINLTYQNTKLSKVFLLFLANTDESEKLLSEKIFYLYQLMNFDADAMILLLSELENSSGKSQIEIQRNFKNALNQRLSSKQVLAPQKIKLLLSEKFRTINFIWTSATKYAEHLIAPRYEWLSYLGLVNIFREKKNAIYTLSNEGILFLNSIPFAQDNILKDINNEWMSEMFFTIINHIYPKKTRLNFTNLSSQQQQLEMGLALQRSRKVLKSGMTFKLPLEEALLYTSIYLFVQKDIVINFSSIISYVKVGFNFDGRRYLVKLANNIKQGYITVTSLG